MSDVYTFSQTLTLHQSRKHAIVPQNKLLYRKTKQNETKQAVMDRDREEGHFQRQAKTMDIIDSYVHDNAVYRGELNLSEPCRQRILASEVTR